MALALIAVTAGNAKHPAEESRTSEYDERKKGWKRCECPIMASGTLEKKFKRQTTGQWEWEAARRRGRACLGSARNMGQA